jgi:tRNA1(Val) A37 N6-methylase TrmN6
MPVDPRGVLEDRLLDRRLTLRQLDAGHRAGTDAILLAAAVAPIEGRAIDAGAGVGTAGLAVALRCAEVDLTLVEINPDLVDLARQNIEINGLSGRARAIQCDLLSPSARRSAGLGDSIADHVLCNPPWLERRRARSSPDPARALAHVAAPSPADKGVEAWLRAAAAILKPDGRLTMIHRADALGALLAGCEGRFGDVAILPIHPRADQPAIRVIVSGCKGSKAPARLLPGLVLHELNGKFTPLAEAIHRGVETIDLE